MREENLAQSLEVLPEETGRKKIIEKKIIEWHSGFPHVEMREQVVCFTTRMLRLEKNVIS